MALDERLRAILVCPQDRGPLLLIEDSLYNPACDASIASTTGFRCCSSTRPSPSTTMSTDG